MKNNSSIQNILVAILLCAPFVYTATIWRQLPEQVALHFGMDGKPNKYGAKGGLLVPVIFMMAVSLGVGH